MASRKCPKVFSCLEKKVFFPKKYRKVTRKNEEKEYPPTYLHSIFAILQFEISSLMNLIFSLFQTWISQATAGRKIQFKLEIKIQFIKLYILNWRILDPYLSELVFSNSPVWNIEFDELDFFPSLKQTGHFFQFKLIKTLENPYLFTLIWHF